MSSKANSTHTHSSKHTSDPQQTRCQPQYFPSTCVTMYSMTMCAATRHHHCRATPPHPLLRLLCRVVCCGDKKRCGEGVGDRKW
jgi:hypothetical protein